MLAQIVVQTNAHPYQTQLIFLWLAIGPVAVIIALLVFVQIWRIRRSHKRNRQPVR